MTPYGCYNKPPRDPAATYPVQDGWKYIVGGTRLPVIVQQTNPMSLECVYGASSPDPRCAGCQQAKEIT